MGVAAFPEHGEVGGALLRAADAALYRAKREGRDQVVLADGSDRATAAPPDGAPSPPPAAAR